MNRLVTCLSIVNLFGQTRGIAQLWKEFLAELRFRYESSILIPDLFVNNEVTSASPFEFFHLISPPDLSRCLLHQKIQMLNCCIKKKIDRQSLETPKQPLKEDEDNNDEEEDDEQFFDCDDELEVIPKPRNVPEGRLKKFENLTLFKKSSEFLYVPITQESTPMTEDMIEQHANVLVNLGSSDDAALLRAKIQSASLLSDMQSFKVNLICSKFIVKK